MGSINRVKIEPFPSHLLVSLSAIDTTGESAIAAAKFNSSKGTTRETDWVSQSTGLAHATCVISVMTDV
jgi:hypothetical protein